VDSEDSVVWEVDSEDPQVDQHPQKLKVVQDSEDTKVD